MSYLILFVVDPMEDYMNRYPTRPGHLTRNRLSAAWTCMAGSIAPDITAVRYDAYKLWPQSSFHFIAIAQGVLPTVSFR